MIRVEPSLNVKTTLPSLPTIYGLSVLKNDVNTLAENQRVYRSTTKNLSNDEITQVRNAFKAANPQLNLNDSDIRIENDEPLSNHPSRVRVTITKGELTKQFISTFDHMDFLKWINLRLSLIHI